MIDYDEPSVWIISKAKVKIALVNFLFIDILSSGGNTIDDEVDDLNQFIAECAFDNEFQSDVPRGQGDNNFEVQECVDDLILLLADTAKGMGLKSIYRDNPELWTSCNINSDLIKELLLNDSLITAHEFKKFKYGFDERSFLLEWTGDAELEFIVGNERFITTIAYGDLEADIIEGDNSCTIGYINEFLDSQNGSVHHCCVVALCWLTKKLFDIRSIETRKEFG